MAVSKKKFYVVWVGRNPGVYDTWDDARIQIEQFPGARYKGFTSPAEAAEAYRPGADETKSLGRLLMGASERSTASDWSRFPEIDRTAWAVDAACAGNPGLMEYRGVDLASGQQIFHAGPFPQATNNIGEFLAIVHALALMQQRGESHRIYSDSRTGMSWVRNRLAKTKIAPTEANAQVRALIARAETWLRTHAYSAPIEKWDTERWGEIPADFGRKH